MIYDDCLRVPCRTCGAKPGHTCVHVGLKRWKPTRYPHSSRMADYREDKTYESKLTDL